MSATFYLQSATWNSLTFNSSGGGPIRGDYAHIGEPFEQRTGGSEYAPFLAVTNKCLKIRLRVRDVKQTLALGTKSNLAMTLSGRSGPVTINAANMVLLAVEPADQPRAESGSATLVFQHESADGTTIPIS